MLAQPSPIWRIPLNTSESDCSLMFYPYVFMKIQVSCLLTSYVHRQISNRKELTQLFMKLATMMAHVGSFDSSIPKGGVRPLMSPSFDFLSDPWIRFSDPPRMCWCSFLEIRGWDCGSLEMKKSHKNSHTNPTSPNAANGADNPKRDNISDGVKTNPATLPRWKPAIVIPTALDRSDWGNHLSCPQWSLKQCNCFHPDLFKPYPLCHWCLTDDLLQLNKKNWSPMRIVSMPDCISRTTEEVRED